MTLIKRRKNTTFTLWKFLWFFIWTNLNQLYPRMHCFKFVLVSSNSARPVVSLHLRLIKACLPSLTTRLCSYTYTCKHIKNLWANFNETHKSYMSTFQNFHGAFTCNYILQNSENLWHFVVMLDYSTVSFLAQVS